MTISDWIIFAFFICCIILMIYIGFALRKKDSEIAIQSIKLMDDQIEKNVDSLTLEQLVDENNKRANNSK